MKKLLSTKYSAGAVSAALLVLRVGAGVLMLNHGYNKLINLGGFQENFTNLFTFSKAILVIFAEFICSFFLIIGLFTRLAAIPLILEMLVLLFKDQKGHVFKYHQDLIPLYLFIYIAIILIGPGKVSADKAIGK